LSSCAAGLPREIEPSKKFRDRALNPGSTRRPPVSVHTVLIYEDGRGDEGGIIRAIVTGLRYFAPLPGFWFFVFPIFGPFSQFPSRSSGNTGVRRSWADNETRSWRQRSGIPRNHLQRLRYRELELSALADRQKARDNPRVTILLATRQSAK